MDTPKKQFGLPTGIAMVMGIVIGSGVFIKAGDVLKLTNGNLAYSLLAWLIGGLIMVVSSFCFALFANKVSKFNGVIDYVEISAGKRVSYHLTWLFTTLYYPTIISIVSIFASAYFFHLTNLDILILGNNMTSIFDLISKWQVILLAFLIFSLFYFLNYFTPRISAKFQISSTIIKIIPILLIVIIGLFASLINKDSTGIIGAFSIQGNIEGMSNNFGSAIKKTTFAYEGWVCATSINAELKDSKKNLPRSLIIGTSLVVLFYIIYYIGVSSFLGNSVTMELGANAPLMIFNKVWGVAGEKIITIFILISCLGTVNGVSIACSRGLYTLSIRGKGPFLKSSTKLNEKSGMSLTSCLFGYAYTIICLIIWALALNKISFFTYLDTMDEIVCALTYSMYIFIFIYIMRNFKDLNVFKRYIMPILAISGCLFFILCGSGLYQLIFDKNVNALISFAIWLVLFVLTQIPSLFFYTKNKE